MIIFSILTILTATISGSAQTPADTFFEKKIRPVLESHCYACHSSQRMPPAGGLVLDNRAGLLKGGAGGAAVVPGQPQASRLIQAVRYNDPKLRMPPTGKLPESTIHDLEEWIRKGATFPEKKESIVANGGKVEDPERSRRADRTWWALQPLSKLEPPKLDGMSVSWSQSAIDRFVYARMRKLGLEPSSPADKRTLIRRATYDLLGLPPTPEEVDSFLNDRRPDAYERLIDRLLSSPHYGERWGRHWLDVIRFGESTGFERNVIIDNLWPFRDYIIRSFNIDKPFNELVMEHLAGDVSADGKGDVDPDTGVATAFMVSGPYDNVGNQDPVQQQQIRANTIDEIITATSSSFLGLTFNCARCHDHKFDPIPREDYYRLQAVFSGVFHGERTLATQEERTRYEKAISPLQERKRKLQEARERLEDLVVQRGKQDPGLVSPTYSLTVVDPARTEDSFPPLPAKYVRLTILCNDRNPRSADGVRVDEFEVWTAKPQSRNVALARNGGRAEAPSRVAEDFSDAYSAKLTIDGEFGASWVAESEAQLTITLAGQETIDRIVFSSDRLQSIPGRNPYNTFVGEYRIEVSRDGKTWTKVADSYDRPPINDEFRRERLLRQSMRADESDRLTELSSATAEVDRQIAAIPPLRKAWAGTFQQPQAATYVMIGGDPTRKGPEVTPASPSVLDNVTPGFRLDPNAAEGQRRMALAKWIVHEENSLTVRVLANRLWHYHFGTGIVDSPSDFGFLGGRPTHPELLDWLARRIHFYGWRLKPLHREIMLSQTYRQSSQFRTDAAKIDAGTRYLWRFPERRLSGEEIRDTILSIAGMLDDRMGGPGFRLYRYLQDNVSTYVPLDQHGPETYRRCVYHQNVRASRVDLLSDFDCPNNTFSAPTRATTTTPLQALTLMNHSFTLDMATAMARRLERDAGSVVDVQVRGAFAIAFARPPSREEQKYAVALIRRHGLISFCRAIINSNELIYVN